MWRLLAYVGRYGHQPLDVALRLPRSALARFADKVEEIVREENEPRAKEP